MKVGILGLGLIGGALARAYAKAGHTVYVYDQDSHMVDFAQLAGVVHGQLEPASIPECDLLLLAIYAGGAMQWLSDHSALISRDALVLDCCGVKNDICRLGFDLAEKYGYSFVGGHPMAGSHNSGFKYSRSNLFQGAPMVLVPPRFDDPMLLSRVKQALEPCGFGSFSVTTAQEHDKMIAFTSQMPHLISNAFIKSPTALAHRGFSAGSYKDMTRVAWLNAPMWTELFLSNRENLLFELEHYIQSLNQYKIALQNADAPMLEALLQEGKQRKEEVDG